MSTLLETVEERLHGIGRDLNWLSSKTFIPLSELEQWVSSDRILPENYVDLLNHTLVNEEMEAIMAEGRIVVDLDEKEYADLEAAMKQTGCDTVADFMNLAVEDHNGRNPNEAKEWEEQVERIEKLRLSLKEKY